MTGRFIGRALRGVARLPLWLAMGGLFVMMVLTFADVLLRSLANAPIPGAAELTELLLALIVFAALPAASMWGRHISVDLFDAFLAPRLREGLANVVFGVLLWWPVLKCWHSGLRTLGYGEVTLYMRVPVGWIILLITAGLALSACTMLLRGLALIFFRTLDLNDDPEAAALPLDG